MDHASNSFFLNLISPLNQNRRNVESLPVAEYVHVSNERHGH